jgi:predicted metal-dependent enzyme (double-stranded beta helix superfamily)
MLNRVSDITSLSLLRNYVSIYLNELKTMGVHHRNIIGCKKYLDSYTGNDWKDYVRHDPNNLYTRTKVLEEEEFDIYVLTWNPESKSKIHNHPEFGCLMRVMQGNLTECRYTLENKTLKPISYITANNKTPTTYIHDSIGYHEIGNNSSEPGVSIHIYSPKNYIFKTME